MDFARRQQGGFGAVLMNGVKRGLFSNEAGSDLHPARQQQRNVIEPVKAGLVQALGVFVDTIVICSCTAMIMLLAPEEKVAGLSGMDLLQTAMEHHLGKIWCHFYCSDAVFVQLFQPSLEFCFMQEVTWHIFSETTGHGRLLIKYLHWSCCLSAVALRHIPSYGISGMWESD